MISKNQLTLLADAFVLCSQAREVLCTWFSAFESKNREGYIKANLSLAEAIRSRVSRLAIIADLSSSGVTAPNLLIFRPTYDAYEDIKRVYSRKLPELPLHIPVELDAGLGPFASGKHLVLFWAEATQTSAALHVADQSGIEFLDVWRCRWSIAVPLIHAIADDEIGAIVSKLSADNERFERAILESILTHELGHVNGALPIFPKPLLEFENLSPGIPCDGSRVVLKALSEVAADVANADQASVDALLATVMYNLLNVQFRFNEEPLDANYLSGVMLSDVDSVSGAFIWNALLNEICYPASKLTIKSLRGAMLTLNSRVWELRNDFKRGRLDYTALDSSSALTPILWNFLTTASLIPTDRLPLEPKMQHLLGAAIGSEQWSL